MSVVNEAFANHKNLTETTESSKSEIVNHKVVGAEVIEPEEIEIKELATPGVSPESQSSKKETKEDRGNDTENHTLSNQNIATDTNNNVHSTQGTEQASFSTNAQQIYDQIGEYVRNLSTENLNEIEMKLQPETLGTLHIRITQSEGFMKAEFLTANENVRAAIEAQLIQLKEDFDRSGIRVDEVEVRVATNEINEATQQYSRDEENEAASRQSNVRRINLTNGIDLDEIEDYEEEEKITVEMMTANGNSLDYKA